MVQAQPIAVTVTILTFSASLLKYACVLKRSKRNLWVTYSVVLVSLWAGVREQGAPPPPPPRLIKSRIGAGEQEENTIYCML